MTASISLAGLFDLSGRRAVVTGASRGIGARAARALDAAGACVALAARDRDSLTDVAGTLTNECLILPIDLAQPDAGDELAAQVDCQWDGADILVNNAGITRNGAPTSLPVEDWHDVCMVNLHSVFTLSRNLGAGMVSRGWGRVITVASALGVVGDSHSTAYVASKHGVIGLTRSLALAWAPDGVTVNALCPGWIDTEMISGLRDDQRFHQKAMSHIAARRWGTPADLDGTLLLLSSPASGYLTGQAIIVDGGLTAGW
jgi:NAD(P)-dependent dehydrogenase (short-subunit alcohol dehydrogenase family)